MAAFQRPSSTASVSRHRSLVLGLLVLALVLGSCSNPSDEPVRTQEPAIAPVDSARAANSSQRVVDTGIVVNGIGVATGEPDIAIIALSVESIAASVRKSRQKAAISMQGILKILASNGIEDTDIKTVQFRVDPQYEYEEVSSGRTRKTKRVLVGFRVLNSLSVTLREIENLGTIIDSSLEIGGDTARVDSISFSVADPSVLANRARRLAVADALAKADLYSVEAGVTRGQLLYLVETGGQPVPKTMRSMAMGAVSEDAGTPFAPGSFKIETKIQATFAID